MPPTESIVPRESSADAKIPNDLTTTAVSDSALCCIENFRPVLGTINIYRCASTDGLGNFIHLDQLTGPDHVVFYGAGLIIDLRFARERDEGLARKWMAEAPDITTIEDDAAHMSQLMDFQYARRFVVRIDVLSPSKLKSYISKHWLTPKQRTHSKIFYPNELHQRCMDALNERGLAGLNECILETAKTKLFQCLETITLYLEAHKENLVVFHCVQGKDR
jgi:hypothetical protein